MVDDANKNPGLKRFGNAHDISSAAVNGEDQLNPIFHCRGDRPLGNAVTISIALRDIPLSDRADRAECSDHDRGTSEPVGIKVTNHQHGLPGFTRFA